MNVKFLRLPDELVNTHCPNCPLYSKRKRQPEVYTELRGNKPAIIFVGEAPGLVEKQEGKPFVGKAGKLLRQILLRLKLLNTPFMITNVVRCNPPGNRTPTPEETICCGAFLEWELITYGNNAPIIALGKTAANYLIGGNAAISNIAGDIFDTQFGNVYPTYHPAAALRNPSLTALITQDISRALCITNNNTITESKNILYNTQAIESIYNNIYNNNINNIILDIETNGIDVFNADAYIRCIGIKFLDIDTTYHLTLPVSMREFGKILSTSTNITLIGHNIKFDLLWLIVKNILPIDTLSRFKLIDTSADYALIDESIPRTDLKYLCKKLFNINTWGSGKESLNMDLDELIRYNSQDLIATEQLYKWERKYNPESTLNELSAFVALHMEYNGIKINKDALNKEIERATIEHSKLMQINDKIINSQSNKQVSDYLYKIKKIKPLAKTTKGAYSTSFNSLKLLLRYSNLDDEARDVITKLINFRQNKKRLELLLKLYKSMDNQGFIHPIYWISKGESGGTVSGRFSCKNPNIQQQPKDIFFLLTSRFNGGILLLVDLSQIELRILAELTKDEELMNACRTTDLHSEVAETVVKPNLPALSNKQMRQFAKRVNFGIVYGISPYGLSKLLEIPVETASQLIDKWLDTFPGVRLWHRKIYNQVRKAGYVESMFGRIRHLKNADTVSSEGLRIIRQAINFPVQSSAAELLKCGIMPAIITQLSALQSKVIANIHDAIMLDIHPDEEEEVRHVVDTEIRNPMLPPCGIGKTAKRWGDISSVPITYSITNLLEAEMEDEYESQ